MAGSFLMVLIRSSGYADAMALALGGFWGGDRTRHGCRVPRHEAHGEGDIKMVRRSVTRAADETSLGAPTSSSSSLKWPQATPLKPSTRSPQSAPRGRAFNTGRRDVGVPGGALTPVAALNVFLAGDPIQMSVFHATEKASNDRRSFRILIREYTRRRYRCTGGCP
jgi:hypothetical protein